jgi:hypothetical protein
MQELLHTARVCEDWDRVLSLLLDDGDSKGAIELVQQLASDLDDARGWALVSLLERHSCELLTSDPEATVDVWLKVPGLDPVRLLPALFRYHGTVTPGNKHEGIRYLEQLRSDMPVVSNALMLFHAQHSESAILRSFVEERKLQYGAEYALKTCRENSRHDACVLLLLHRGAYEEAVSLALEHGLPDLAQEVARKVDDDDLRRRLWLSILSSRGTITVHECMKVLAQNSAGLQKDGSPLLRLEHMIPLLDDFVVVSDLKELVCESLASHAGSCAELRKLLDGSVQRAEALTAEIAALRSAHATSDAEPSDPGAASVHHTCNACKAAVFGKFVVYPCGHAWHEECLQSSVSTMAPCLLCSDEVIEAISTPFLDVGEVF